MLIGSKKKVFGKRLIDLKIDPGFGWLRREFLSICFLLDHVLELKAEEPPQALVELTERS